MFKRNGLPEEGLWDLHWLTESRKALSTSQNGKTLYLHPCLENHEGVVNNVAWLQSTTKSTCQILRKDKGNR